MLEIRRGSGRGDLGLEAGFPGGVERSPQLPRGGLGGADAFDGLPRGFDGGGVVEGLRLARAEVARLPGARFGLLENELGRAGVHAGLFLGRLGEAPLQRGARLRERVARRLHRPPALGRDLGLGSPMRELLGAGLGGDARLREGGGEDAGAAVGRVFGLGEPPLGLAEGLALRPKARFVPRERSALRGQGLVFPAKPVALRDPLLEPRGEGPVPGLRLALGLAPGRKLGLEGQTPGPMLLEAPLGGRVSLPRFA